MVIGVVTSDHPHDQEIHSMPTTNTIVLSTYTLLMFVVSVAPLAWAVALDGLNETIHRVI